VLFYVFDIVPYVEDRIDRLRQENIRLAQRKIELTKNHEVFPIGFVVSCTHPVHKWFLTRASIGASLVSLGSLLVESFRPDARLPKIVICAILIFGFAVPCCAFLLHRRTLRRIEAANAMLERQIEEAQAKPPSMARLLPGAGG
jgi:hypothetical protein